MKKMFAVLTGALVASASALADERPEFCTRSTYAPSIDDELSKYGYNSLAVSMEIAGGLCDLPKAKPEKAQKIKDHYAKWKELNGFTEEEAMAFAAVVVENPKLAAAKKAFCEPIKVEDEEMATQKEAAYVHSLRSVAGCDGSLRQGAYDWPDHDYLARGLDIATCIYFLSDSTYGGKSISSAHHMLQFAECEAKASHYDLNKAQELVRSNASWNAYGKGVLLSHLHYQFTVNRPLLQKAFGKFANRDAVYEKFMMTEPQKAYQSWMSFYEKNQPAMDAAYDIVAHGKNRYLMKKKAGCEDKYFKDLQAIIKSKAVKAPEDVKDLVSTPLNALVAAAYVYCEAAAGREALASAYVTYATSFGLTVGPGDAAYKAAVTALAANRDQVKEAENMSLSSGGHSFPSWGVGNVENIEGVIANIKKKGELAEVSFKRESWKEPILNCVETNKIDRITDEGQIKYRLKCKQTGTRTVNRTEPPITIPADQARALKKGAFASFWRGTSGVNIPLTVYSDKNRKKLVGLVGLTLK